MGRSERLLIILKDKMDDETRKQNLRRKNIRLAWILVAIALVSMVVAMLKEMK